MFAIVCSVVKHIPQSFWNLKLKKFKRYLRTFTPTGSYQWLKWTKKKQHSRAQQVGITNVVGTFHAVVDKLFAQSHGTSSFASPQDFKLYVTQIDAIFQEFEMQTSAVEKKSRRSPKSGGHHKSTLPNNKKESTGFQPGKLFAFNNKFTSQVYTS